MEAIMDIVNQAKVLYSLDKYDEAIALLKKAEETDPYCVDIYENLAVCYIMKNMYDDAKEALNRCLLLDKNNGTAFFHLGNISLLEENVSEAKAYYSKAEISGYNNPLMYLNLASFFEDAQDYLKAAEQYNKILRDNPYDYDTLERKTEMLFRAEKFEEAFKTAKQMVTTDIDRFEGHHFTYIGLIMLKRYSDAASYIDSVISRFPDNETAKFDKLRLLDLSGNKKEALACLEKQYPNCEEMPQVALLKVGLLLQEKRVDEVIAFVERSKQLLQDETILTIMYSLYYSKGEYSKARQYCEMIQKMEKKSSQYYATMYYIPLIDLKIGKDDIAKEGFVKAIDEYKKLCSKNPIAVDIYMFKALCEYQTGQIEEAKNDIDYLLAMKSDEAIFHLAASEIYKAYGDSKGAEEHRNTAKKLDPEIIIPLI